MIALGLAGLLVMLRLEASRFSAAEYDDAVDGHAPSFRRRIAWYAIGLALVAAIYIVHPSPSTDLALGPGDRGKSIFLGLVYGAVGTAIAMGVALYRYRRLRFPDVWSYPGALLNSVITAIIDEVAFRGAVLGALLLTGLDAPAAIVIQAIVYALATRLGAPGRNRWLLLMALGIGLAGGWVTWVTGGIAAAFLGHAITRFAVFLSTGHAGPVPAPRPGGRGDRGQATAAEGLARHRAAGAGVPGSVSAGDEAARVEPVPRSSEADPAPLPPAGLYVHVPFCVSLCPYCDFVVVAGAATRGPTNRIGAFVAALRAELALRADALALRFGPPGSQSRAPLETVYLGGGTPTLLPADVVAGLLELIDERFGIAGGAEITIEANPGPDERGDPAALARAGINRISFGAQSLDRRELRRLGRRHRPRTSETRSMTRARQASPRSIWTCCMTSLAARSTRGSTRSRPPSISSRIISRSTP